LIKEGIFLFNVPGLVPATLPALAPLADQEFEAESIDLHTWLETDAEISEVHLVFVRVGEEETEMASDGEEEIIVEG